MRFLVASFFCFITLSLSAQFNAQQIYVDAKTNSLEQLEIKSLFVPVAIDHDDTLTDVFGFDPNPQGNLYTLDFQSIAGYTGDLSTVIEYTEPSLIPGIPQTNYLTLHFRVKPSKVSSANDYILSDGNTTAIHPLLNDSSSDGSLTIAKLGHVSGGSASIVGTDQIDFDLEDEKGTIIYFAQDSLGTISSGTIFIHQEDDTQSEEENLFVDNQDNLQLLLPAASYNITVEPTNGTLIPGTEGFAWTYEPDAGFEGQDAFTFTSPNGGLIEYTVDVLDKNDSNSFLVDDEVFIPTNGTATFDVLSNDLRSDFNVFSHSPELTQLSNGVFEYTPSAGFQGDLEFEYKIFTGLQLFTTDIIVHVSDFAPTTEENYQFEIVQDQPLRIVHNTPSSEFEFFLTVPPSEGQVVILDASGEVINNCDTITGENIIVYTPNTGYAGSDEFDIEYCTTSGNCEIVKVDINILNSTNTDCLCIEGCVYEGDHNDDGRVDIKDILDLGLNVGEGGPARNQDFSETWTGQFSADWGYEQMSSNIDLKCGDSDGDGFIDESDIASIEANYGQLSRFQAGVNSAISEVPVYFIPQQTEVDSGDLLVIDIVVGDANYPAIDMNGLAFTFNINPEWIDSSSVNFYLYDNNWISYQSPVKDFFLVPEDGRVDIAVTRYGNGSADGMGIIGALEFIVEDEVQGLKRAASSYAELVVQMSNIISVDEFGTFSSHPSVTERIKSTIKDNDHRSEELNEASVTTYPNPTSDVLNISSRSSIEQIDIVDTQGRLLKSHYYQDINQTAIDISHLENGIYFFRMTSGGKTITKKISKLGL